MITVERVIAAAGWLHFCQIPAMMMAPKMLAWESDLAKLADINRAIFKVIAAFIVYTVLGLGLVVGLSAGQLTDGSMLATGLTLFLSLFWLFRCAVQLRYYSKIWPQGPVGGLSHYGLVALFGLLCGLYAVGFVKNALVRMSI